MPTLVTTIEQGDLLEKIEGYKKDKKGCFIIIVNVGQNRALTTEAVVQGWKGSHWASLVIYLDQEKWLYSDTLGWKFPKNLFTLILPFVRMLREVYKCTLSFDNFIMAHLHLNNMQLCGKSGISNFPYQASILTFVVLHTCSLHMYLVLIPSNGKFSPHQQCPLS